MSSIWYSIRILIARKWFSPVYILKCFLKIPPCEKALEHWSQGNGFSPECVFKCVFKFPQFEKALGHWLQGNGFHLSVSTNFLYLRKSWDTGYKEIVFHLSVFLSTSVSSYVHYLRKTYNKDCKKMIFLNMAKWG